MAITKQKKEEILSKVQTALEGANSVVFVNFEKLTVAETTQMRTKLRENDVKYFVAKKTLIKRALGEKGFEGAMPEMPGELAIAYGEDLVAPAREVFDFAKTHKEQVSIMGGVFEGRFMDASQMTEIASIPGQQTLYAQFVNLINSPLQRFAVVLDQIAQTKES